MGVLGEYGWPRTLTKLSQHCGKPQLKHCVYLQASDDLIDSWLTEDDILV